MCGIFGFNWDNSSLLKKMNKAILHRGPDDAAFYSDKNISLGMRRLSIIDLKKGIYPITNESGSLIVVFNGELYNYKEIKEDLIKKKHKFKTDCDAEIIPHAYEEYGESFVSKINGMFAICMYDTTKKRLFLIRDRLGIKPIYYYHDPKSNKFLFASEIKSILEYSGYKKTIDTEALNNYFTFRYTPGENTLFKGIKKLAPGQMLILDKKLVIKKYWNLVFESNKNSIKNNSKYLLHLLEDSVKMRLMSDVPLGAYLSGGLDSSAIVAMMSKYSDNVNTFNVSFSNTEFDESKYAQIVADKFNTNHKQIDIEVDAIKVLPEVAWHLDEPIADAATLPTYLMSKETKKYATVVLTGEGSDELFGGYERFRHLNVANKLRKIPEKLREQPSKHINKDNIFLKRGTNLLRDLHNPKKAYMSYYSFFDQDEKKMLYSKKMPSEQDYDLSNYFQKPIADAWLSIDIKERLPNNMLLKNDKMTMAASIEGRVPFLDHRVAEFSSKIPFTQKVSFFQDKMVYREAVKEILPKEISKRKKQGFTIPTEKWVKEGLGEYLFELIKKNDEPYLNKSYVQKILSRIDKSFYYKRQFWAVLMYEQWYDKFM